MINEQGNWVGPLEIDLVDILPKNPQKGDIHEYVVIREGDYALIDYSSKKSYTCQKNELDAIIKSGIIDFEDYSVCFEKSEFDGEDWIAI